MTDKEKQMQYWKNRNESLFLAGEEKGLDLATDLKTIYEQSLKRLTSELYIFYNEYAKEGKLTLEEAKKRLSKQELKLFHKQLKEYTDYAKENQFNDKLTDIKLLKLKVRVSRLEALKAQIEFELSKLANETEVNLTDYLESIYQDGYYKTIFNVEKELGFKIDFAQLNTKLVEKAVSKTYNIANYSVGINKVWENKDNLMLILNQSIPQGLTLGYNPKKLAEIVSKKLKTNYNATVRLMRTEYNLLLNEATSDGYKACGIEQYQILATLDNRTSEICQDMDGQIFNAKDKEVGVNYPPFHPNCRTTTIPYFEPDEIDEEFGIGTRLAKDENGAYYEVPANITYKQWKELYIK